MGLAGSEGLALIRRRWVEVDREKLAGMLTHFRRVEKASADGGISFVEAMRMLAGASVAGDLRDGAGGVAGASFVFGVEAHERYACEGRIPQLSALEQLRVREGVNILPRQYRTICAGSCLLTYSKSP